MYFFMTISVQIFVFFQGRKCELFAILENLLELFLLISSNWTS